MIKRLALLICCILLLPTIAAAQEDTNYGDWWVGGQVVEYLLSTEGGRHGLRVGFSGTINSIHTDAAVGAGAIVGYNFCMSYRPSLAKVFRRGPGLPMEPVQPVNRRLFGTLNGNQFALALLGRLQYPLMGDESFTRGRFVPFLMAGPAVVWTIPVQDWVATGTDVGVVAEVGFEYFVMPQLSIGPSFRYRYVWAGRRGLGSVKVTQTGPSWSWVVWPTTSNRRVDDGLVPFRWEPRPASASACRS